MAEDADVDVDVGACEGWSWMETMTVEAGESVTMVGSLKEDLHDATEGPEGKTEGDGQVSVRWIGDMQQRRNQGRRAGRDAGADTHTTHTLPVFHNPSLYYCATCASAFAGDVNSTRDQRRVLRNECCLYEKKVGCLLERQVPLTVAVVAAATTSADG